jgi:Cobalamin-independent synthase, N-terminal domain
MTQQITIHNLGFPRLSGDRDPKKAQESCWRNEINQVQFEQIARALKGISRVAAFEIGRPQQSKTATQPLHSTRVRDWEFHRVSPNSGRVLRLLRW